MPLFFIIAIAAGGIAVGATAVDVTQDTRASHNQAQLSSGPAYATLSECREAATREGRPLSTCDGKY